MRSSISLRSPKSDRLAALAASSLQSKLRWLRARRARRNPARALPADRVGCFEGQERLVAVDRVQGPQLAREMAVQLLEPERGHALFDLGMRRRQAPHDLLHHVGLHVAVEQLLLVFLAMTCASL